MKKPFSDCFLFVRLTNFSFNFLDLFRQKNATKNIVLLGSACVSEGSKEIKKICSDFDDIFLHTFQIILRKKNYRKKKFREKIASKQFRPIKSPGSSGASPLSPHSPPRRAPSFRPTSFRLKFSIQSISSNPIRLGLLRLGLDETDWTKTGWTKMNYTKNRSTASNTSH